MTATGQMWPSDCWARPRLLLALLSLVDMGEPGEAAHEHTMRMNGSPERWGLESVEALLQPLLQQLAGL